mmetsp:Transcript_115466/g.331423  ORF Transcript_115466/g.331423 Transcript_115466/m.331423 type:complete len:376 (+) Transcript_115466:8-1135(+)
MRSGIFRERRLRVLAVCAGNCVISITSTCLYYAELRHLEAYPFFTIQLNTVNAVLISFIALAKLRLCRLDGWSRERGLDVSLCACADPPAVQAAPLSPRMWVAIAALSALQTTMEIVSIPRIGNDDWPPVLQQAVVPLTFAMSTAILRASYTRVQMLGAALVVVSVLPGFLSQFFGGRRSGFDPMWAGVFLLARVPQALYNVLAEGGLQQRQECSWIFWATLVTQALAVPFSLFFSVSAELARGGPSAVWRLFLDDFGGGLECVFRAAGGEHCATAWHVVLLYSIPGALYTISAFQVVQYASATTYFLLVAFQLPIQDLVLSLPQFSGSLAAKLSPALGASALLVGAGLALYGLGSEAAAGPTQDDGERPPCASA